jgi:SAM-dependent methyltransferase
MGNERRLTTQYERFANAYARHAAVSPYNVRYERPAMQAALGDVRAKIVLEAGCASGESTALLLAAGAAQVIALDASAALLDLVRARFDGRVRAVCADLSRPLGVIEGASVDVVFSSLTLHYLADWTVTLAEFRRVLVPGGTLLFSTHHPAMTVPLVENYFATQLVRDVWSMDGAQVEVSYYHRPLQAIVDAVRDAGFSLERMLEPRLEPAAAAEAGSAEAEAGFARLARAPWFLIVRATKPA